MKKLAYTMAFVAALLGTAVALNPSPDKHRAQIKRQLAERSLLAGWLGLGSLTAFMSNYHSLGVMSYTVVDGKVISVGAFGVVVVTAD